MATTFWLSMGYNYGCGSSYPMKA